MRTLTSNFNPRSSCEERRDLIKDVTGKRFDFNPRSSCEERPTKDDKTENDGDISIHAPHARSDLSLFEQYRGRTLISIHAPHARSDKRMSKIYRRCQISIHAPHARSDRLFLGKYCLSCSNFNPRSSCEERLILYAFNWTATSISIHAPHARSDGFIDVAAQAILEFQSTLLMRGATCRGRLKSGGT